MNMDFCRAGGISNLAPHHHHSSSSSKQLFTAARPHLRCKPSLPSNPTSTSLPNQGLLSYNYKYSSLRSTISDETSSGTERYDKDESPSMITFGDGLQSEGKEHGETFEDEVPQENPLQDAKNKISEFFDQLNSKIAKTSVNLPFDSENSYPIFLYGGTATAALFLATTIVGAIDSIPVFPKIMELVGLGYTLWFGTRYLIYKSNRDELAGKIEEIKQQILGSKDD